MKFATHDSLTGYPVKSWWLRPFNFTSRTQTGTLIEQFDAGAVSFDLRFAKHKGKWYGAHTAMLYNITLAEALLELASLPQPVYFRALCEDTFFRKSDVQEMIEEIEAELDALGSHAPRPLYIRSKRTWQGKDYTANAQCANFDIRHTTENDRDSLCEKVSQMYELQTTDDKMNFVGCYESGGIPWLLGLPYPRLAAKALTPIALKKKWKTNDIPVVDFI